MEQDEWKLEVSYRLLDEKRLKATEISRITNVSPHVRDACNIIYKLNYLAWSGKLFVTAPTVRRIFGVEIGIEALSFLLLASHLIIFKQTLCFSGFHVSREFVVVNVS